MDEALELGWDMLCRVDEGGAVWDVLAGEVLLAEGGRRGGGGEPYASVGWSVGIVLSGQNPPLSSPGSSPRSPSYRPVELVSNARVNPGVCSCAHILTHDA